MDSKLIRVTAEGEINPIGLSAGRTLVGRQDHCQIRIPKPDVSREHCEFVSEEDTGVSVKDLGSSNGTYVNRERVEVAQLAPGDLVSVGGIVFVLQVDGHPEQIDAALCYEDGLPAPEAPEADAKASAPAPATPAHEEPATKPGGLLSDEFGELGGDPEDSSVLEFDFDLDDDLEDQPEL